MDTFQFYLTEMGFVSLILIILSLVITAYLLQGRPKSRSSWLLIGFFAAVIANSITMLLANAWVFWGELLMPAQDAWILVGGVALGQFAYRFPQYDQKGEARLVLALTGCVALLAVGYSIYYALQYAFYYFPGLDDSEAYYLLLPVMTLFILGVFLRRAVHYAAIPPEAQHHRIRRLRQVAGAIVRPQNREVRTLRDFALALSLGLLPGIAYFLKPLPMIPGWLPSYMLSIGSVLAVAALALVYLNNSGEQTSFIGKIMGFSLVAFLLIFGAFGLSIIDQAKNRDAEEETLQVAIAHRSILANEFSSLPAPIIYIAPWEQDEWLFAGSDTSGAAQNEAHHPLYLRPGQEDFNFQSLVEENQIINSGIYPNFSPLSNVSNRELEQLTASSWQRITRHTGYPYGSETRYYGYLFDHNNVYEIGFSQTEKLENIHRLIVYLAFWVLLTSLIIIFLFPIFYRFNLVLPLNHLLAGVKRANRGEIDIHIPIQYEDEIGYLTRSFNRLLSSLYKSNLAREELDAELEQRIEELLLSEEKFSKAFHSSPVAMVLQNRDNQEYLDVNEAFTRMTGYLREEAVGHRPRELNLYPTQKEANRVAEAMRAASSRLRNFEFEFLRKSGQVGTGLLSSEFYDLQGIRILLGIVMDISARKQAEDQIRRLNREMEVRVADRSRELSTFLDLAFLVSHQESLDQIFVPALERILEISGFQAVCLHVYSSDRQYLSLEAQVGLEKDEVDLVSTLLPRGNFASWLGRPRDPLLLSNLESDTILPAPMHLSRLHACLVAQLVVQGEVLGVMSCYRQDVHTFSLDEISLLVAIAEQLGVSLENHRLRLEAEQAAIFTERRRLARDLHDSITQSIYGLTLFTRSSQDALRAGDQAKLAANLEQIEKNAVLALKEMRLLLYQMQPKGAEGGFAERINARLDLVERRLGIQATCQLDDRIRLSPETDDMLFRIALEALNNSLKHARANRVHISLEQNDGVLLMEVADDGQGFDLGGPADSAKFSGMGLKNMHARAAELNGQLEIISSPRDGTRVRLSIDLNSVQV